MLRLRSAWLAFVLATLLLAPTVSQAVAVIGGPFVALATVADSTTAIPGGSGTFTGFIPTDPNHPPDPCISAGNIAFWGAGVTGQQGIYALRYGVLGKVSDLNTPVPGGTGTSFAYPPDPCMSGAVVSFYGVNASGQTGIYAQGIPPAFPTDPWKIADASTLIPGGTGSFTGFADAACPAISGTNAAFIGNGANGQQGVYASFISNPLTPPGPPSKIADLTTPVPGGTGTFTGFGGATNAPGAVISGTTVAFIGTSAGGGGLYVKTPQDPCRTVVDFNTSIPGGTGMFFFFRSLAFDGNTIALVGGAGEGQQGVYTVAANGPPIRIADLTTQVPGTTVTFTSFGIAAIDPAHVVFDAWSTQNGVKVHGLYTNLTGSLTKLVDTTDSINGKALAAFSFGTGGFSGNQVVFAATFTDGSQAIASATVVGNHCPASAGYWKNHPGAWPTTTLILGNQSYSQRELLAILNANPNGDASLALARQLIAAKLNLLNFANPAPAFTATNDADSRLAGFAGKLPYGVTGGSATGQAMGNDADTLSNYNSGQLTPGCLP